MDVFETRRANLISFINDKFEGNRASFCRATGKNPNLINLCLTLNKDLSRRIGEKLARDIEKKAGLPALWLDSPKGGKPMAVIDIPIIDESQFDEFIATNRAEQHLRLFSETFKQTYGGRASVFVLVHGDTMSPTVQDKSVVAVDMTVNEIKLDGIYYVNLGFPTMRRVQRMGDGGVRLISDNQKYSPIDYKKPPKGFKVYGQIISVLKRETVA